MDNKMFRLNVAAERGVVLNGVLFRQEEQKTADTVMISITGRERGKDISGRPEL